MVTPPNPGKTAEKLCVSYITGTNVNIVNITLKDSLASPFQINTQLPYDLAITHLGMYPGEMKTSSHMKACTRIFIVALLVIAKTWNQPRYHSIGE